MPLRGFALALLWALALAMAAVSPAADAQPGTDPAGATGQPVWLSAAWLRLVPPAGWQHEAPPADAPIAYDLRYVRPTGEPPAAPLVVQWRLATDAETGIELLAERQEPGWLWARVETVQGGNLTWQRVEALDSSRKERARWVMTTAVNDQRVVLVADAPGSRELLQVEHWFRGLLARGPVDRCEGMFGIPGEDRAVPLPSGFRLRPAGPAAPGTICAVLTDSGDDDGEGGEGGEGSEGGGNGGPAGVTRLIASVVRGPEHDTLDAAFGPVERQFERQLKMRRNGGEPRRVKYDTRDLPALVTTGTIGDGGEDGEADRGFVAWYVHDAVLRRLLVVLIECEAEAEAVARWRDVLDAVVPQAWWPAPTVPPGLERIELSGEMLTVDGADAIAQLNLLPVDQDGRPVVFAGSRWVVNWQLSGVGQDLQVGPLECISSGDCLANGRHGASLRLDPATVLNPPPGARIVVIAEFDGGPTLTESRTLAELFGQ